jgi:L-arabinose isomerase
VPFADPETITLPTAGAQTLARTGYPNAHAAEWKTSDDLYTLFVSHDTKKRDRTVTAFTRNLLAADPYVPTNYNLVFCRVQLTIDRPIFGFTAAQEEDTMAGFLAWLTASSNAKALLAARHAI